MHAKYHALDEHTNSKLIYSRGPPGQSSIARSSFVASHFHSPLHLLTKTLVSSMLLARMKKIDNTTGGFWLLFELEPGTPNSTLLEILVSIGSFQIFTI